MTLPTAFAIAAMIVAPAEAPIALSWQGTARIHAAEQPIDIGVSTRVVPFVSARSESWLLSDGPSSKRVMIVGRDGGWLERNGRREPMPEAMFAHERQQYAIYGLMLLADRLDPSMMEPIAAPAGMKAVRVRHPEAPITELVFGPKGRLVEARNRVADPEGGGLSTRSSASPARSATTASPGRAGSTFSSGASPISRSRSTASTLRRPASWEIKSVRPSAPRRSLLRALRACPSWPAACASYRRRVAWPALLLRARPSAPTAPPARRESPRE